jgi:hypothetical protein
MNAFCGGLLKNPKLSKNVFSLFKVFKTKILPSLALEIQFFNTLVTRFDVNMLFKRENFIIKYTQNKHHSRFHFDSP